MRRVALSLLFVLLLCLAPAQANTVYLDVDAFPERTQIGGSVTYVISMQSSETITSTLTIDIPAQMTGITITTIPETTCAIRSDPLRVSIMCDVQSNALAVTVRGTLVFARPRLIITAAMDGATAQDVQFISGVRSVYLPIVLH